MDLLQRNVAVSYGLTLVAGLPLPQALIEALLALQSILERQWAGLIKWYAPDHLHVTLAAPLRGRYRLAPPLQRTELPAAWPDFVTELGRLCTALPPIDLGLSAVLLRERVFLIEVVGGATHAAAFRELISRCDGFDSPNQALFWPHVSFGSLIPGATIPEGVPLPVAAPAEVRVFDLSLVHYANRTLSSVVGQARLALGAKNILQWERLLNQLGIGP